MSFEIKDTRTASWAMRKITAIKQESEKRIAWHKAEIEKEKQDTEKRVEYLKGLLYVYMMHDVPMEAIKQTKTQSKVSIPGGELVFKPSVVTYTPDDAALLAFVKADPALSAYIKTKVTESVDWAGLKKVSEDMILDGRTVRVLSDTGEVLPVEVTSSTSFDVKPSKDAGTQSAGDFDLDEAFEDMQGEKT